MRSITDSLPSNQQPPSPSFQAPCGRHPRCSGTPIQHSRSSPACPPRPCSLWSSCASQAKEQVDGGIAAGIVTCGGAPMVLKTSIGRRGESGRLEPVWGWCVGTLWRGNLREKWAIAGEGKIWSFCAGRMGESAISLEKQIFRHKSPDRLGWLGGKSSGRCTSCRLPMRSCYVVIDIVIEMLDRYPRLHYNRCLIVAKWGKWVVMVTCSHISRKQTVRIDGTTTPRIL